MRLRRSGHALNRQLLPDFLTGAALSPRAHQYIWVPGSRVDKVTFALAPSNSDDLMPWYWLCRCYTEPNPTVAKKRTETSLSFELCWWYCRSTKEPFCASNASFQKSQEKLESHGNKVVPNWCPAASLQYAQNQARSFHHFSLRLPSKTNRRSTHSSKVNPNINFCKAPTAIARYHIPASLVSFREQLYRKWPTSDSLVQIANQRLMVKFQKQKQKKKTF